MKEFNDLALALSERAEQRIAELEYERARLYDIICDITDCTVETCALCGELEMRAETAEHERDDLKAEVERLNARLQIEGE